VAQQLRVLQSLWAMERRLADEPEWPLQTQLAMIRDAGFDGAGMRFIDPAFANGGATGASMTSLGVDSGFRGRGPPGRRLIFAREHCTCSVPSVQPNCSAISALPRPCAISVGTVASFSGVRMRRVMVHLAFRLRQTSCRKPNK
jgi:hypothetical protein